jgi:hypothetical protein
MIAMKVYDLQWFTTFGMDYARAAEALRADGVDTVLTQNAIDPLPSSGVDQTAYRARFGERLARYRDDDWMAAIREAGMRAVQTTATFFDPAAVERFPDARPINAEGEPDRGFDWYLGVCPTSEAYLAWKIERLRRVVDDLAPDGLFLQFTRFPGFWENWTWNPDYRFSDADRWCFCDRCRTMFRDERDIDLSGTTVQQDAALILERHAQEWVEWRCAVLERTIARIIEESGARRQGMEIWLNTLPFPSSDFGRSDVRRTIGGQDLRLLDGVIDRFELMTYLQILNRPVTWLAEAVADARSQVPEPGRVVCTLQVAPLYTDGVHAGRNRAAAIDAEELREAGATAWQAGAGGLVFYHWTDFLEDEAAGGSKRQVLRELAAAKEPAI